MYQFRIHHSTITKFIPQVLDAIYTDLKDDYLKCSASQEDLTELAGAEFYNYKGFFSIVLMALVDYDNKFIYVDVGCQGCILTVVPSETVPFMQSNFIKKIQIQVFSCEYCGIFKITCFEEHLRTAASIRC